jgi:hypothetical protein
MKGSVTVHEKIGALLRTNKFAILLEIAVVSVPFIASVVASDWLGSDLVPLGGDVVLLGPPLALMGMIISLAAIWVSARMRGVGWR